VLNAAFQLGIRIAGPAVVAIFLATLALGFISRTMPQLNILAAGFPLRIALGFILLVISFSMTLVLFQDSLIVAFRQIGQIFV
jgi:flagellar biosynthesis protein FliR